MHKACTNNIDHKVRKCATKLRDTKLLAELHMSDMHALDAEYHGKCLVALYNRVGKLDSNTEQKKPETSAVSSDAIVLAELASYEEVSITAVQKPVFKLSDSTKLYEHMHEMDCSSYVHSIRLKERLMADVPGLQAHTKDKEVLLAYENDISSALFKAYDSKIDSDTLILAKAAKIAQKELFEKNVQFDGTFSNECLLNVVSPSLFALTTMILEGSSIQQQSSITTNKKRIGRNLSQMMLYNSVKHESRVEDNNSIRYTSTRETPVAVYVGLKLYASTRQKRLTDSFHQLGFIISYERVLTTSTQLANSVCKVYTESGIVCPPTLRRCVYFGCN